ncbi:MAG: glycosyltransferase family 1 protein [Desulfurococcaceae archaeon]
MERRNLTLYIDGLFYRGSGIGRYYESLLKEFVKKGLTVYTCVPKRLKDSFEKDFHESKDCIIPIFVDYEKFALKGFIKQSNILKKLEKKVDLFFYPHVNLPLYVPKNTVTTIHDLIPFTEYWNRDPIKKKIFSFYLKRALKKSAGIFAISHATKRDIERFFGKDIGKKIKVIYEFVDEKFVRGSSNSQKLVEGNYLLFVGNRKRHKNLRNLILAFNKIKENLDVGLVIAGPKEKEKDEVDTLIEELNLKDRVVEFTSPKDEEIINLYKHAKLFVFPSFFEGFGLPPLEALSLNCPVIASDIPVLKETLGSKIACFNPYDVEDMAQKILRALIDEEIRQNLLEEGRERLKLFDREKIVEEYLAYFKSIAFGA